MPKVSEVKVRQVLFEELYRLQGEKAMLEKEIRTLKSDNEMLQDYLKDEGYRPYHDESGTFWAKGIAPKHDFNFVKLNVAPFQDWIRKHCQDGDTLTVFVGKLFSFKNNRNGMIYVLTEE